MSPEAPTGLNRVTTVNVDGVAERGRTTKNWREVINNDQRDRACLLSMEKAERLPPDHPRSLALRSGIPPRTQRDSWRRRGEELTKLLTKDVAPRLPLQIPLSDPWMLDNEFEVHPGLPGVASRDDE